jgi:hypothetical protein
MAHCGADVSPDDHAEDPRGHPLQYVQ